MQLVQLKGSEFDFSRIHPLLQGYLLGSSVATDPITVTIRTDGKIDPSIRTIEDPKERTQAYLATVDNLVAPLKTALMTLGVAEEEMHCFHLTKAFLVKVPFPVIAAMSKNENVTLICLSGS